MEKLNVMGPNCLLVEKVSDIRNYIEQIIDSEKGGYSVAINAEKIMMYNKDPEMKKIMENSILPTPDGAGAVLGMKIIHGKKSLKIDLPKTVLQVANEKKYKLFVLGASEENNKAGTEKLISIYPGIEIVGRMNGYYSDEKEVEEAIIETKPQIVLLALGSPKQEIFASKLFSKFKNILFLGCGGALDILAGKAKRAPKFFIENNLEWFYRLVKQPSRIKRQWILPVFLFKLLAARLFKS